MVILLDKIDQAAHRFLPCRTWLCSSSRIRLCQLSCFPSPFASWDVHPLPTSLATVSVSSNRQHLSLTLSPCLHHLPPSLPIVLRLPAWVDVENVLRIAVLKAAHCPTIFVMCMRTQSPPPQRLVIIYQPTRTRKQLT